LASKLGYKLCKESLTSGTSCFELISPFYKKQQNYTFCGIASSVIVLNASQQRETFNEETMFQREEVNTTLDEKQVKLKGMTLDELNSMLKQLKANTSIFFARDHNYETFCSSVVQALKSKTHFVVLNYSMRVLGQCNLGGHISPIAAYHPQMDRFLIMDVWPDTESVWATTNDIWNALNTIDPDSGKTRGWIILLGPNTNK